MAKKKTNVLVQKSRSEKIVFSVAFVLLLLYALSFLYPLIWLFLNSLKMQLHYVEDLPKVLSLPKAGRWEFENYVEAFENISWKGTQFVGMFFNSIWTCVLSIAVNMFLSCCTGYVLSKYKFKGRDFIYATAIVCMTLPIFGTGGASYKFYYTSGMYDTPFYIIFSSLGAFGTRFLMLYAFFKGVSWEYAEAVLIDGGNDFTVFFKIMLPIALPMITTLSITGFIGLWNAYEAYLIYIPSYPTLAVGLYQLSEAFDNDRPVYYASMIISIIPVITIFIIFSDTIMKNFSIGGLKG